LITVPSASHSGTIQFRFLFTSDGGVSDEDGFLGGFDTNGAIVIDDLVVIDQNGVVDSQDFELESVDDGQTLDGDWIAGAAGVFGNFGGLFSGLAVVQEDPMVTNVTNLWGFFNGSPNNFVCGGFPGQATVPVEVPIDLPFFNLVFIRNEVRSPVIDITQDENGKHMPPDAPIIVSFDVYRDLPLATGVRYRLAYRSIVDGCPGYWRFTLIGTGADKKWFRESYDITAGVDPTATEIQIALQCSDLNYINDTCHTHSPLFDNVHVGRVADALIGVGEVPAAQAALHQNVPNPFNPTTEIRYQIERSTHVRLTIFSPSGARVRTLVDGVQSPLGGGNVVTWDGRDESGKRAASGVYFYRLEAAGTVETRKMVLLK
jgi:hypothetical protein